MGREPQSLHSHYIAMQITGQQEGIGMAWGKRVPTGVDTRLITPYPLCSRYEFQTFSKGKNLE
jgi:hypothetical protein